MKPSAANRTVELDSIRESLSDRFRQVRAHSDRIKGFLRDEDCIVQSMPDVSPTRWHLAHTSWFFETFVLKAFPGYRPINESFEYLFNSYYNSVGEQYPRDRRGMLTRPTVDDVLRYRAAIDEAVDTKLNDEAGWNPRLLHIVELGLQHEMQHQELMLTDIKHVFGCNPLYPAAIDLPVARSVSPRPTWLAFDEGVRRIGHRGNGFAFDNEAPSHRVFNEAFDLRADLVTNREMLAFIEDDGYCRANHWLSEGWATVTEQNWRAPLNWVKRDDAWFEFTMAGLAPLDPDGPLTHVSYFEADALASWSDCRLPTEAEWEIAVAEAGELSGRSASTYLDDGRTIHPAATDEGRDGLRDLDGCVWQWTSSAYSPYPGFRPAPGALGEYNGKFMCNQYVLRGGSCATSSSHTRATYRNFFPTDARWQFSGVRLARSSD